MTLERWLPVAVGAVAVPVAVLAFGGVVDAAIVPIPVLAGLIAVGGVAFVRRRSLARFAEVRWGRAEAPSVATERPASLPARGSVARSLGRVEARELATSGWFGAGVGFCLFIALGLSVLEEDFERSWWGYLTVLLALAHPLCGFTVVAAHRAVTRGSRDGLEELYESCPAPREARTTAHLVSAWVPAAAAIVFAAAVTAVVAAKSDTMYGPIDGRVVADAILVPVLAVGAVALGVAVGRWFRFLMAPVLAVVAVAVIEQVLFAVGGAAGRLSTFGLWPEADPIFFEPRSWARLGWIGGLTVVVAGATLARQRQGQRPLVIVGLGVAVTAVAAGTVLWPLPDSTAARLAAYVVDPEPYEVCRPVESVRVCVLEPYADLAATYVEVLAPVVAAIPPFAFDDPVTMRAVFDGRRDMLPAEVKELVPDPLPERPPGTVRLSFQHTDTHIAGARFRLAAHAVGLPSEVGPSGAPTIVAGQARGVLVLWYATRGLSADDADDATRSSISGGGSVTAAHRGDAWPTVCGDDRALQWSQQDLEAARMLLALPEQRVNAVLAAQWDRWLLRTTSTDELLDAFDLPPVGPPDVIEPLPAGC